MTQMTTEITGHDIPAYTWDQLVSLEPRLAGLLKEADAVRDPGGSSFCANSVWYTRFKPRLVKLVGWGAEKQDKVLRSPEAYDLSYEQIYYALPSCRNCMCL